MLLFLYHPAHLRQIDEELIRLNDDRRRPAHTAPRFHQFAGVHQLTATVALVATRILVAAAEMRAGSFDEPIGQVACAAFAQQLVDGLGVHVAGAMQIEEHLLGDSV